MKEISIKDIQNIRIGQVENAAAGTGCTVLICRDGMRAGLDVRGGGPASRESQLLNPLTAARVIHGIVLAGGSAFGLGAADGVMRLLEERGIGYDVGVTKVPLVAQADLFDLTVGDPFVRPEASMGYEAAGLALDAPNYRDGNYGAGCGATVGKITGMGCCMKTGMGSFALELGALQIGAVVALNALGDVFNWRSGEQIAGVLREDRSGFRSTAEIMSKTTASLISWRRRTAGDFWAGSRDCRSMTSRFWTSWSFHPSWIRTSSSRGSAACFRSGLPSGRRRKSVSSIPGTFRS